MTLAKAKVKTNETFIVQASLTIVTYDHQNMILHRPLKQPDFFFFSYVDDGDKWNETASYEATENEVTDAESGNGKIMNLWVRIIWDSLFIVIIFVATLGNLMVLWIIAGDYLHRQKNRQKDSTH